MLFIVLPTLVAGGLVDDLKALSFPKAGTPPAGPAVGTQPEAAQVETGSNLPADDAMIPVDFSCKNSPTWTSVKNAARSALTDDAGFGIIDAQGLEPTLHTIMDIAVQDVKKDECGLGKLMVQLLAILASDSNGLVVQEAFKNESLTSPILTLLLDFPWPEIASWPFMGIFAQIAARRVTFQPNDAEIDGFGNEQIIAFATGLSQAIVDKDWKALMDLSQVFIEQGEQLAAAAPIGYICALFTRAAGIAQRPDLAPDQSPQELVMLAQMLMKQLIKTPDDFLVLLSTRWPLWGMAHRAMNHIGQLNR